MDRRRPRSRSPRAPRGRPRLRGFRPARQSPASVEYMPGGKFLLRPRSARSPSVTSMITAGSVRGKCIALQSGLVQRRICPASSESVGLPHRPQKRCRECHHTIARASASSAPSWRASLPASWRRSANQRASPSGMPLAASAGERSMSSGVSICDRSTAKCARSSMTPRKTRRPRRDARPGGPRRATVVTLSAVSTMRARLGVVDVDDQVLRHRAKRANPRGGSSRFA